MKFLALLTLSISAGLLIHPSVSLATDPPTLPHPHKHKLRKMKQLEKMEAVAVDPLPAQAQGQTAYAGAPGSDGTLPSNCQLQVIVDVKDPNLAVPGKGDNTPAKNIGECWARGNRMFHEEVKRCAKPYTVNAQMTFHKDGKTMNSQKSGPCVGTGQAGAPQAPALPSYKHSRRKKWVPVESAPLERLPASPDLPELPSDVTDGGEATATGL